MMHCGSNCPLEWAVDNGRDRAAISCQQRDTCISLLPSTDCVSGDNRLSVPIW